MQEMAGIQRRAAPASAGEAVTEGAVAPKSGLTFGDIGGRLRAQRGSAHKQRTEQRESHRWKRPFYTMYRCCLREQLHQRVAFDQLAGLLEIVKHFHRGIDAERVVNRR